ncbi:hypothetical protein [Streptomyces telluris]|uniref:Secreted protein n=1 Tax=Streptomyces telluris TaxID=2720021 RepID=A0A9X2LFX1_9ACTN|nr:hypothetical protein [Streptomyces telluris]MCQ8770137.1 hypothetical protein [Streptomyces telluris]NJP76016.1 hypothetical protein [Streptomyces telluris]
MAVSIRTRLAAALGTLVLAAGGAVIAAPAAHASSADCSNSRAASTPAHSTSIGDLACRVGATGLPTASELACNLLLTQLAAAGPAKAGSDCTLARR